jgi:hypothetical protein
MQRNLRCGQLLAVSRSPISLKAVKRIDAIFDIEREVNGKDAVTRLAARHERSRPLVEGLRSWLIAERGNGRELSDAFQPGWLIVAAALRVGRLKLGITAVSLSTDIVFVDPPCVRLGSDGPRVAPPRRDACAVVGRVSHPISGRVWLYLVLRAFRRLERPCATDNAPNQLKSDSHTRAGSRRSATTPAPRISELGSGLIKSLALGAIH